MTEFIHTQNSFAAGEIAPEFYLTKNINGVAYLENMDVLSGGGLARRPGLTDVANLLGRARLISFDASDQENYILALTNFTIQIFNNDTLVGSLSSPWPENIVPNLQFAIHNNTIVFTNPDVCPYVLTKRDNIFTLEKFKFYDTTGTHNQIPFMKYDDMYGVSIAVSSGPNGVKSATITASQDYWTSNSVGTALYFNNQQWEITEYVSPTVVYARSTLEYSLPSGAISDWTESAFDNRHGWPRAITFHQDRLVFACTRATPGGIWMSRVGEYRNFDAGTGLDDEAISTTLLSKERHQICNLISSDKLQILTSYGEWSISDKPLTPSNINIVQQTSVGCATLASLTPQKIEGETVFISNTLTDIRKLSLDALGDRYNADDLCAYSKHLINNPIDITYNKVLKQLYVVNNDGTMAVLHQDTVHGISAWTRYKSYGNFVSIATAGPENYVVLEHESTYKLSKFVDSALTDSGIHNIEFRVSGLPMNFSGHRPKHLRLRKINLRLWKTKAAFINDMRVELPNEIYAPYADGFSGDISMNFLGSQIDESTSPWTIHGHEPAPITVLSVSVYGRYEI